MFGVYYIDKIVDVNTSVSDARTNTVCRLRHQAEKLLSSRHRAINVPRMPRHQYNNICSSHLSDEHFSSEKLDSSPSFSEKQHSALVVII